MSFIGPCVIYDRHGKDGMNGCDGGRGIGLKTRTLTVKLLIYDRFSITIC